VPSPALTPQFLLDIWRCSPSVARQLWVRNDRKSVRYAASELAAISVRNLLTSTKRWWMAQMSSTFCGVWAGLASLLNARAVLFAPIDPGKRRSRPIRARVSAGGAPAWIGTYQDVSAIVTRNVQQISSLTWKRGSGPSPRFALARTGTSAPLGYATPPGTIPLRYIKPMRTAPDEP